MSTISQYTTKTTSLYPVPLPSIPTSYNIFNDTAVGATPDGIRNSAATIWWISSSNITNSGAVYIQLYNLPNGSVNINSTAADMVLFVGGSSEQTFNFPTGITFPSGLSAVCVTTSGGNLSPTNPVILTIAYQ
jgi:hypothetical protein